MSLRKKLTLSMLMIAVIPVMVLGSFYYQYFSGVLLSNVQQRELQNNSQIIYSVDNFFNSIFKISDSLLMNEELMDILQKSYEEQSSPLEGYRGKAQVDKLLLQGRLLPGWQNRDYRHISEEQQHVLLLHKGKRQSVL